MMKGPPSKTEAQKRALQRLVSLFAPRGAGSWNVFFNLQSNVLRPLRLQHAGTPTPKPGTAFANILTSHTTPRV